MKTTIVILATLLTGCAASGNDIAAWYDQRDPCQTYNKPEGYRVPGFCGSSGKTVAVIRDAQGRRVGTITDR